MQRLVWLDTYRGIAIVLMVIFHFTYDLHYFHFIDLDTTRSALFRGFRIVIVSMFLSAAGMSFYLVYRDGFHRAKYLKRLAVMGAASLAVTAVSLVLFPQTWIYFGVLHFLFVASAIAPLFARIPMRSLLIGIAVIAAFRLDYVSMHPLFEWLAPLLHLPMYHTEDLVPLIPWFGVVAIGIGVMAILQRLKPFDLRETVVARAGRHSLAIYLLHQPLLFALLYPATLLN